MNDTWKNLNGGVYLILSYESCGTSDSHGKLSSAFRRLKYLQQRYLCKACWISSLNLKLVLTSPLLRYPCLTVFALRYPRLTVFAMEHGSDISSLQRQTVRAVIKEYLSFPILMSDKDFTHVRHITLKSL